jgi:hypothetical protein
MFTSEKGGNIWQHLEGRNETSAGFSSHSIHDGNRCMLWRFWEEDHILRIRIPSGEDAFFDGVLDSPS